MQQTALVYEIHEDRIQKLESCLNETNAKLVQNSTTLDHIADTVDSVKLDMRENMDKGFHEVKEEIKKTSAQLDKLSVTVQDHNTRIQNIERTEKDHSTRWELVVKVGAFILAGVGGAIIKQLVDQWMKH